MNCVVCGKCFESEECPRCGFPVVRFPGPRREGLQSIRPQIEARRNALLRQTSVGIWIYHWQAQEDEIVCHHRELLSFGSCAGLDDSPRWLAQPFARVPGPPELSVLLELRTGDERREQTLKLPNPAASALLRVGLSMDADRQIRLHIREEVEGGRCAASRPLPLWSP